METRDFIEQLVDYTNTLENGLKLEPNSFAGIIKTLTLLEVEPGGPYSSISDSKPDFGLNIAVANFLRVCSIELPKLNEFIKISLANGATKSAFLDPDSIEEYIVAYKEGEMVVGKKVEMPFKKSSLAILTKVRSLASRRFSKFDKQIKDDALAVIERTIKGNPDSQMTLMTFFVRESLGKKGKKFTDEQIAEMGLANVCFWTAFIIYDDFWDEDEAADPKLLPIANVLARHYINYFNNLLPTKTGFAEFATRLMDKLDEANAWETRYCRAKIIDGEFIIPDELPEYGNFDIKFYPASSHILGPVSMLVRLGYSLDSKEVKGFVKYFQNYLIAMQLNDDAHDWKEDLGRGHISTAVSMLLEEWQRQYPKRKSINLVSDMPELEKIFWFQVIRPLCEKVLARTKASRRALNSVGLWTDLDTLEYFINRNEASAQEALDNFNQSQALLEAFKA